MMAEPNLQEINRLFQLSNIDEEIVAMSRLSGTTAGRIYKLESSQGRKYILKFDEPGQIQIAEQLLRTYRDSNLLPKVLYTSADHTYFIYTYLSGTTHINRGTKETWLTALVKGLLNYYVTAQYDQAWGRMEYPLASWLAFNEISIEEAKYNIGNKLTPDDYLFVQRQVTKLFGESHEPDEQGEQQKQEERFLLHGDLGVHNFVFDRSRLAGIIDPSPINGPLLYDFIYAFCSSPDDLDTETLFTAYEHLEQGRVDKTRLIDEVSVQLYCRIGLSIKHHPGDLPEYLQAWSYWRGLCENQVG